MHILRIFSFTKHACHSISTLCKVSQILLMTNSLFSPAFFGYLLLIPMHEHVSGLWSIPENARFEQKHTALGAPSLESGNTPLYSSTVLPRNGATERHYLEWFNTSPTRCEIERVRKAPLMLKSEMVLNAESRVKNCHHPINKRTAASVKDTVSLKTTVRRYEEMYKACEWLHSHRSFDAICLISRLVNFSILLTSWECSVRYWRHTWLSVTLTWSLPSQCLYFSVNLTFMGSAR